MTIEPSPVKSGPTECSIFSNGMLTARINKQGFGSEKTNNRAPLKPEYTSQLKKLDQTRNPFNYSTTTRNSNIVSGTHSVNSHDKKQLNNSFEKNVNSVKASTSGIDPDSFK